MTPFMRYLKRQSLSHFFVHLAGEDSGEKTPGQQQEEGLKGRAKSQHLFKVLDFLIN